MQAEPFGPPPLFHDLAHGADMLSGEAASYSTSASILHVNSALGMWFAAQMCDDTKKGCIFPELQHSSSNASQFECVASVLPSQRLESYCFAFSALLCAWSHVKGAVAVQTVQERTASAPAAAGPSPGLVTDEEVREAAQRSKSESALLPPPAAKRTRKRDQNVTPLTSQRDSATMTQQPYSIVECLHLLAQSGVPL